MKGLPKNLIVATSVSSCFVAAGCGPGLPKKSCFWRSLTAHLTLQDALDVYAAAGAQEKRDIRSEIEKKVTPYSCGLGITNDPSGFLALNKLRATGLMFDPSRAIATPPKTPI